MSWNWRRVVGWILFCLGCFVTLIGVWAIGGYIWGVVSVLDEPDQSWMFWGLAILFVGVAAVAIGIGMTVTGWSIVKKS